MKTKNVFFLIFGGIATALGLNFLLNKKSKTSTIPNSNNYEPPKITNLYGFSELDDFNFGGFEKNFGEFISNENFYAGTDNLIVKKGEKVNGRLYQNFIFNKIMAGLSVEKSNGKVFIPIENLTNLDGSKVLFYSTKGTLM